MLQPGEDSPHIRRRLDLLLRNPRFLPPSVSGRQGFGQPESGGRSEFGPDRFRLVVPEGTSKYVAPPYRVVTLLWMLP